MIIETKLIKVYILLRQEKKKKFIYSLNTHSIKFIATKIDGICTIEKLFRQR